MPPPLIRALSLMGLGFCLASPLPSAAQTPGGSAPSQSGVRVETLARSERCWDGRPLPADPSSPPLVTVLRITIPAGSTLPWHHHPVINAGVLLQGRLQVEQGTARPGL
ncbi:MAG: hypothetical protein VKK62_10870 [Synechococcaceae cyanobacterium]|nr:hypothetical protein [Synechococcaceae cyanobacterium]